MTLHVANSSPLEVRGASTILKVAHVALSDTAPGDTLKLQLGTAPIAHAFVFAQSVDFLETLTIAVAEACPEAVVSGCTTAGQIGASGYEDDNAVVIALPETHFATRSVLIENLNAGNPQQLTDQLVQNRVALEQANRDRPNGFGFLLVDGLSLREDELAAMIAPAMGTLPMFGGSAGDGVRFRETKVAHEGQLYENAAVVTFVATDCDTEVFSLDHLEPTDQKMVVTEADPERRIVKEINAEPAAREYARIVGKDPDQLDEFTFAAHPVVVRLGDTHHVRAIQRVNRDGDLVFFAAIDEGMVLTVATASDIATHLDKRLSEIRGTGGEMEILACDCVLRRIEASQVQATRRVSDVLSKNNVVGFSTYGEQIGPIHVNHTMTGVALRKPAGSA